LIVQFFVFLRQFWKRKVPSLNFSRLPDKFAVQGENFLIFLGKGFDALVMLYIIYIYAVSDLVNGDLWH